MGTSPTSGPGGSSGGASPVQVASLALTSAQILALNTTPLQVVAAPGAHLAAIPIRVGSWLRFGTLAYVTAGVGAVVGWLDGGTTGSDIFDLFRSTFLGSGDSEVGVFAYRAAAAEESDTLAVIENQPLMLGADSANPTTGDGTAGISVAYMTMPTI